MMVVEQTASEGDADITFSAAIGSGGAGVIGDTLIGNATTHLLTLSAL